MGNLQLGAEDRATLAGDDNFEDFPLKGPPRSGVIQSAGKELDPASPKFIPGAQAGLIGLRFSRDELKAVRNFNFIPFATEPTFNVYEPSVGTVQGGLVDSFKQRPREARWQTDANGRRRCMLPDGNIVKESPPRLHGRRRAHHCLRSPFVRLDADLRHARSLRALFGHASRRDEAHSRAVRLEVVHGRH